LLIDFATVDTNSEVVLRRDEEALMQMRKRRKKKKEFRMRQAHSSSNIYNNHE